MQDPAHPRYRTLVAGAGAIVLFWGVLGLIQAMDSGQAGYETRWGAEVAHVEPGGPADVAGLEAGDRILSVNGVAIQSPWLMPSRGRVGVGEARTLQVERGAERRLVEVTRAPLSSDQVKDLHVEGLVTLAFLALGLWAFLSGGTRSGLVLAVFGLCYGMTNFPVPGLGLPDEPVAFVQSNLSLFYTALLCHFLMVFPKPKGILRRRWAAWVLYAPFLLFLAFGFAEWFLFPAFLSAYATAAMFTDLLYMLLALAALIHSWASLPRSERRESGFHFIPLGLLLAIGPFLVLGIIGLAAPEFSLPGHDYLPLLGVAIPAGLALAVVKQARTT